MFTLMFYLDIYCVTAFDLNTVFEPQSKQMMRNKQQQWHIWQDFTETLPRRNFSIAGSPWPHLVWILSQYHENMWESLRKYLSQADTASHFYSISSLWISADLMARKHSDCVLRVQTIRRIYSPHLKMPLLQIYKLYGSHLEI